MRRAITAISFMFFGASILIFISALLIPLLKDSPSPKGKFKTGIYKTEPYGSPGTPGNAISQSPIEQTQSGDVSQKMESSSGTIQSEVLQNDQNELTDTVQPAETSGILSPPAAIENAMNQQQTDTGIVPPQQTAPATTTPQIPQETPSAENVAEKPPAQQEPMTLLVLDGGFFSSGAVTPGAKAREAIDQIIPVIRTRPLDNVLIEGHADKILSDRISPVEASKLNKTISLRRAIAVAMVLEQKGVASDRIIVSGRGDSVPIDSNFTEEGRAKNRRVEIKLSPIQ